MGREGVAYTFVSPEEGPQLTRIEMRIERLLKRDEIPGFEAFDRRPKTELPRLGVGERGAVEGGQAVGTGDDAGVEQAPPAEPKKPSAAALLGKGRAPKRHRRAL
jgi:ATP-dependent RNA helicase DeaD